NIVVATPTPTITPTITPTVTPTPTPGAVIRGRAFGGSIDNVGDQFIVLVDVESNATSDIPVAFSHRVGWNAAQVAFVSSTDGDLGPVSNGPEQPNVGVTDTFSLFG